MKKYGLIILIITLIACSNDQNDISNDIETSVDTTDSSSLDQTTTSSILEEDSSAQYSYDNEKMSPFTGLEISPELWLKRPRRVIAFKIDNNLNARPQSGLQEADLIMEILVEGGMTRFLAFFMDKTSTYLGPIRSARPTDPTLIRPYGGILVVSGATAGLIPTIRELGVPVLEEQLSPIMFRINNREAPHNLYADTELVRDHLDDRGFYFNQNVNPIFKFGYDQNNWLDGANRVTVKFSEFTTVIWKLDQASYARFIIDGYAKDPDPVAHNNVSRDGTDEILLSDTLIMIEGPLYNDESTTLPSVLTVGVGPVTIFNNGKYIEGTWRRNFIEDPFEFFDNEQNKIEIPPSKQWVHILPTTSEIIWSDN